MKYAVELMSIRSANICKTLYPDDPKMQFLAELFTCADSCFKILTSTKYFDKEDKMKNALGTNLPDQLAKLDKFNTFLRTMKFSGRPRFHKGLQIAMECAKGLQEYLAENHSHPHFLTNSIIQDFLESFFGVIRAMGGANNNPDTIQFLQRVKHYITQKILEDESFDIFSMQEALEEKRDLSDLEYNRSSNAIFPEDIVMTNETIVEVDDTER